MVTREVTIQNELGIHCRPSAVIIKELSQLPEYEVRVHSGSGSCDARSILGLMSMGLGKGDDVRLEVTGPEEDRVADELAELFSRHFDFPPAV